MSFFKYILVFLNFVILEFFIDVNFVYVSVIYIGIDNDSWYGHGLMVLKRTHDINMNSW